MKGLLKKIFEPRPCKDCGPLPKSHFQEYIESFCEVMVPKIFSRRAKIIERLFEKLFLFLGFIKKEENFSRARISLRTTVFIEEGQKRGIKFWAFRGPAGYINHFHMERDGRAFSFEGLPRAEFLNTSNSEIIDDKALVKAMLLKYEISTPCGRHFWFFSRQRALKYALRLGFPLVVKPRFGSMSQHVTVNIRTAEELKMAISRALRYNPCFIIERYLEGVNVFRATVVDGIQVACVKRVPANVIGDGVHTVRELIEIKNSHPSRGSPRQKDTTLYKIIIDDVAAELLQKQGFDLRAVPEAGQRVWLQEKIILDLGADLEEVTPIVHQDNLELFRYAAKIFNVKLVGIDFLAEDISQSWREQECGVIELNSLPYIDMHHFPSEGEPVNVASWLCDMVEKYYKI